MIVKASFLNAKNGLMDLMDNPRTGLPTSSTGPTKGTPLTLSSLLAPPIHLPHLLLLKDLLYLFLVIFVKN
jgi:hypothetical protein